jgi:hypothetical protein
MEDLMRLDRIAVALAAATLCAASEHLGAARDDPAWTWSQPPSCTPEVRTCLEKLEARLGFDTGLNRIDKALLELYATDPQCALLLDGVDWHGR